MQTETLDFWVGNFNTEEDFYEFVEEDDTKIYSKIREYIPIT